MRKNIYILSILLLTSLAVPSCHRRPLWVDLGIMPLTDLAPDWSGASESPEGCEAFIYRDGELYRRVMSNDIASIRSELPNGSYRALVLSYSQSEYWSMDFEGVESLESFTFKSRGYSSKAALPELYECEWLSCGLTDGFTIDYKYSDDNLVLYSDYVSGEYVEPAPKLVSIPSLQRDVTSTLRLKVWVKGARTVSVMKMLINGVSAGWHVVSWKPLDETGSLNVGLWKRNLVDDTLAFFESEVTCFGFPEGTSSVDVELLFTRSDESTYYTEAVTVPVRLEDGVIELVVGLEDDPLVLPALEGGGFGDAWVDGWGEEHETEIPM